MPSVELWGGNTGSHTTIHKSLLLFEVLREGIRINLIGVAAKTPPPRPGIVPVRRRGNSIPRPVPNRSKGTRGSTAAAEFSGRVHRVVGASSISFASAPARKLTYFAAPPLQIEPTSLGFVLGQERRQGKSFPHAVSVLTVAKSNRDSLTPPRCSPLKRLCFQGLLVLFASYRWNDRRKSSGNRHRRQRVYCALLNT